MLFRSISAYKIENGSFDNAIKALGEPDTMINQEVYYYFDGLCSNSNLVDSADICYLRFKITDNIVSRIAITCL